MCQQVLLMGQPVELLEIIVKPLGHFSHRHIHVNQLGNVGFLPLGRHGSVVRPSVKNSQSANPSDVKSCSQLCLT